MDLSWWKWDERVSTEEFINLVLHLERENCFSKDIETIDKLFCKTDENYIPDYVIGIINVESKARIKKLQEVVLKRNKIQKSEVLMIYRLYDYTKDYEQVEAYYCSSDLKTKVKREATSNTDDTGYWMMCYKEEYKRKV